MQLVELNLNWNQIRELPVEIGKLFRLEKLMIDGLPLVKPPQDILAKGCKSIVRYFKDRLQGTLLIVLTDSKAGDPPPPRVWISNPHSDKSNLQAGMTNLS